MFCSSCGAESGPQYCKRCGANLIPSAPAAKPQGLVWVVAFGIAMMMGLPLGGITVVYERLPVLLESHLPLWLISVLGILAVLVMPAARVLVSRLPAPVFKTYPQAGQAAPPEKAQRSGYVPPPQIAAPPPSVHSVVEDTTRSFDALPHRDTQ